MQRWASECGIYQREVRRGELVWLRRGSDDKWVVTCGECEPIDPTWERATKARRTALERDDDPDGMVEAILRETPPEHREATEDDLTLRLEAGRA